VITDCFSGNNGLTELTELAFFADTILLTILILPGALCYTLWRVFITNKVGPRAGITVLGLDDSSYIYSELGQCRLSRYVRFSYILTGIVTFLIGLLASDAYWIMTG
jgi:hypothetical protein